MRTRLVNAALGGGLGVALLAACGAVNIGLSPKSSVLTTDINNSNTRAGSVASNGVVRQSRNVARLQFAVKSGVKDIKVNANTCCYIAVDSALGHIYVGQVNSLIGEAVGGDTAVVEGGSLSVLTKVHGFGGARNVDSKTHGVWLLGGIYGAVEVFSGAKLVAVDTFGLSGCPATSWVDAVRRYAWIASDCYTSSSSTGVSIWVVNADTRTVVAGPIDAGNGSTFGVVNSTTGKYYISDIEIDPSTNFATSPTSFGAVLGTNDITGILYAQKGDGLNIVNGSSDRIERRLRLSYAPGFMAVNSRLNHIYLSNGGNSIQIRGGSNGKFIRALSGPTGARFLELGADARHARVYALGIYANKYYLYQFDDTN